jgi:hypothetical protein
MYKVVYITENQAEQLQGNMFNDASYYFPTQDINGNWYVSEVERDESQYEWLKNKESTEVDESVLFEQ